MKKYLFICSWDNLRQSGIRRFMLYFYPAVVSRLEGQATLMLMGGHHQHYRKTKEWVRVLLPFDQVVFAFEFKPWDMTGYLTGFDRVVTVTNPHHSNRALLDSLEKRGVDVSLFHVWGADYGFPADRQLQLAQMSERNVWVGFSDRDDIPRCHRITNSFAFNYRFFPGGEKIGFPARFEQRKNVDYLNGLDFYAFTDLPALRHWAWLHDQDIDFLDVDRVINYAPVDEPFFFESDKWRVAHCCYDKEPFGYAPLEVLNHGKLPVIADDWCPGLQYPFRASGKQEFDRKVAEALALEDADRDHVSRDAVEQIESILPTMEEWANAYLDVLG